MDVCGYLSIVYMKSLVLFMMQNVARVVTTT